MSDDPLEPFFCGAIPECRRNVAAAVGNQGKGSPVKAMAKAPASLGVRWQPARNDSLLL